MKKKLTLSTKTGVIVLVLSGALAQSCNVQAGVVGDLINGATSKLQGLFTLTRPAPAAGAAAPVAVAPAGYDSEITYDAASIASANNQQQVVTALNQVERMKAAANNEVAGWLYDKHVAEPLKVSSGKIQTKLEQDCTTAESNTSVTQKVTDLTALANKTSLGTVETQLETKIVTPVTTMVGKLGDTGLQTAFTAVSTQRTQVDMPLNLIPVAEANCKVFTAVQAACNDGLGVVKSGAEAELLKHMENMHASSARSLAQYQDASHKSMAEAAKGLKSF